MSDPTGYQSEARAPLRAPGSAPRQAMPRQALPTNGEPRLTRKRRTLDPFFVDKRLWPPGMSYEWKAESIYGQPNGTHMIEMRENHWTPVPASRHPELAAAGDTVIRRGGTILCERPSYLTDEAKFEDIQEAMRPLQAKEELLFGTPAGQLTRDHSSVRGYAGVRVQHSPGAPIDEGGEGMYSEP
jgi:hypothetical protein